MKIKDSYWEKIVLVLFSLIFYQKYGGSFFSVIPVTAYLIIILSIIIFANQNKKAYSNIWFLLLFLFVLNMFASLLWTNAISYGTQKVITIMVTIFIFYLLFPIIHKHFVLFIKINIGFYLLFLINLYYQYGFFEQLADMLNVRFRLGWDDEGSALNPIGIARYLLYGFINIGFYFIINKKNRKSVVKILLIGSLVIGLIYLFFTGTKAPIVAFIGSIVLFMLLNKYITSKLKIILLLLPLVMYSLFSGVQLMNSNGLTKSQEEYISYRYLDTDSALSDRAMQNKRALTKIASQTFILGAGSGDFGYLYTGKDIRDYPHNIISEILYENGIFNVLILLSFIIYFLSIMRSSMSLELNFYIIIFYYFFINSLFSGDLIGNNLTFGFIIFILIYLKNKKKRMDYI